MSIRFGVVFFFTPIFGSTSVPTRIKILSTAIFSFFLLSNSQIPYVRYPNAPDKITIMILLELINSSVLAFAILCGINVFKVAGRLIDLQIGFGSATLLDPTNRSNAPMLSVMLELFVISVLLGLNLHHTFLAGLSKSIETMPLGMAITTLEPTIFINQFGLMFSLGVACISAVMFCLLIVDITLGIASKFMPQANIFILSMQLKTAIGILALATTLPYIGHTLKQVITAILATWKLVI